MGDNARARVKSKQILLAAMAAADSFQFGAVLLTPPEIQQVEQHWREGRNRLLLRKPRRVVKFVKEICHRGATFADHALDTYRYPDGTFYAYYQRVCWPVPLTMPGLYAADRSVSVWCAGGLHQNSWAFDMYFDNAWLYLEFMRALLYEIRSAAVNSYTECWETFLGALDHLNLLRPEHFTLALLGHSMQ
jgi:hypothetical protein